MPIKAVFFDIDGTLVDSNDFHVRAWDEALHDHGYRIPQPQIRAQIGKGADQLLPALLPGIGSAVQERIASKHGELFKARYLHQVRSFPAATDLIDTLHTKGKRIVLASSADKAEVVHYIDLLQIGHALTGIVTNEDVDSSKPAGDIFAAALAQVFPVSHLEAVAVGDTPYDVASALKSQIKTLAVRSGGFSKESLAAAGAAWVYGSVQELLDELAASPLAG